MAQEGLGWPLDKGQGHAFVAEQGLPELILGDMLDLGAHLGLPELIQGAGALVSGKGRQKDQRAVHEPPQGRFHLRVAKERLHAAQRRHGLIHRTWLDAWGLRGSASLGGECGAAEMLGGEAEGGVCRGRCRIQCVQTRQCQ